MKKIMFVVVALVIGMSFIGESYAKKEVKSFRDPGAPDVTYDVMLVDFDSQDYSWKVKVEDEIKKRLEKKGSVKVIVGHDLFYPTRKYSEAQKDAMIRAKNIEAVLRIILAERDITKTISVGQTVTANGTAITHTEPVISVSNLLNSYLHDLSVNKDVWFASLSSHDFPDELTKLLMKSGFVAETTRTRGAPRHR